MSSRVGLSLALFVFAALAWSAACHREVPTPVAASLPPPPPIVREVRARVEVAVTEQGFVPATIPAKAGQALTLAITRKTEQTCATAIVFAGDETATELPLGKTVEVTYTPKKSGPIKFGCTMGMMIGGVIDVNP